MGATSLGGFFATLSLKTDKGFEDAKKQFDELDGRIKKTGGSFNSFVGEALKGLAAIGAAAVGTAYAVAQIQGKNTITAAGAGMKFDEYNRWSVALGLVGGSIDDLAPKLTAFEKTLSGLVLGNHGPEYEKLAKDLALFGNIDINKFKAMTQTQRMTLIADMTTNEKNPERKKAMQFAAQDMLGDSFFKMLLTFENKNSQYHNSSQLLAQADRSSTTSSDGVANMQAFDRVMMDLQQDFKTVGDILGTALRKPLGDLANFMEDHKGDIQIFMDGLVKGLNILFGALGSAFKILGDIFVNNPVMKTIWGLVGKGADIGKAWDKTKGFDTDDKVKVRDNLFKALGYDDFTAFDTNATNSQYKSAQQYHDIGGGYITPEIINTMAKIEKDNGLTGDRAMALEAAFSRALDKHKPGTQYLMIDPAAGTIKRVNGPVSGAVAVQIPAIQ